MNFGYAELAPWSIWWLIISVAGVGWLTASLFCKPKAADLGAPRCERCGYVVAGLPSVICPECGSDLNASGVRVIRPAAARRQLNRLLLAWLLIVAPSALALTARAVPYLPAYHNEHYTVELVPASGAYKRATIYADADGFFKPQAKTIKLNIEPPNGIIVIVEFHPATNGYSYPNLKWQTVSAGSGFSDEIIFHAMSTGGIDTGHAGVRDEARQLESIMRQCAQGESPLSIGTFQTAEANNPLSTLVWRTNHGMRQMIVGGYIFWLLVFGVGAWRLRRTGWFRPIPLKT